LFARLMQYRAFKQAAALIAARMEAESARVPRSVSLDDRFASLLPDVLITLGPDEFALLAARALAPREQPVMALDHLHAPHVSVREEANTIVDRLRRVRSASFRSLTADSPDTLTTVARFLALLELFREGAVAFEQVTPLGELSVRWTGPDDGEIEVVDEYDESRSPTEAGEPAESVTDADIERLADTHVARKEAPT
ncbi:MAG: segregation/condensation protein A, partial [Actinomycetota bacterium]|nr:segregation/condensation protein A [Actinomycetota bacterium]